MAKKQIANLEQLLDAARDAGDGSNSASVQDLLDEVGHRSFGPLLLILALVAFTPLGGIPGLPTVLASMVILVAAQLVVGRKRFWLPSFVLRRSIERQKLKTTIGYSTGRAIHGQADQAAACLADQTTLRARGRDGLCRSGVDRPSAGSGALRRNCLMGGNSDIRARADCA